jgi:hypothetical protein
MDVTSILCFLSPPFDLMKVIKSLEMPNKIRGNPLQYSKG